MLQTNFEPDDKFEDCDDDNNKFLSDNLSTVSYIFLVAGLFCTYHGYCLEFGISKQSCIISISSRKLKEYANLRSLFYLSRIHCQRCMIMMTFVRTVDKH